MIPLLDKNQVDSKREDVWQLNMFRENFINLIYLQLGGLNPCIGLDLIDPRSSHISFLTISFSLNNPSVFIFHQFAIHLTTTTTSKNLEISKCVLVCPNCSRFANNTNQPYLDCGWQDCATELIFYPLRLMGTLSMNQTVSRLLKIQIDIQIYQNLKLLVPKTDN